MEQSAEEDGFEPNGNKDQYILALPAGVVDGADVE